MLPLFLFVLLVVFILAVKKERLKSPEIIKPAPTLYFEVTISISVLEEFSAALSKCFPSHTWRWLAELRRGSDVFLPGRCAGVDPYLPKGSVTSRFEV